MADNQERKNLATAMTMFAEFAVEVEDRNSMGIVTQKPHLRQRLEVEKSAERLKNFFRSATELAQVLARACGHTHLNEFCIDDLTTWNREMAHLTGIAYGGVALD